ncbi:MAG: hypothetical protein ABFC88_13565 [Thermoguttaceae bacterium]
MRSVNVIRFVLLLICWLRVESIKADSPPVQVVLLESVPDQGGIKIHKLRLTLTNSEDHPIWYILPFCADRSIPANGVFSYKDWKPTPGWGDQRFGGERIKARDGWAVQLTIQNRDFVRAFHLPPKSRFVLDDFHIEGKASVLRKIEMLEAREVKVNGKTPLGKWLPYNSMCSKEEPADLAESSSNLDWDRKTNRPRDDYPKEKVQEVIADGVRHWSITVQRKQGRKAP